MRVETTTCELKTQLLHGWLGSLALHGLLLLTALSLFRLSPPTVPKEPLHWDVILVHSTSTADKPAQNTRAPESTASKPTERTQVPPRTGRTIQHLVPATDQSIPIAPQTTEPVAPMAQHLIASSAASPQKPVTSAISERPGTNDAQASDPPLQQAKKHADSTSAEPSTPQAATATAHDTSAQPSPSQDTVSNIEAATTPRPDYAWLQQAISRRLEELKRSSHPSLDESRPLNVMVKAVVSREGILLDSVVVKSSGLDRIDQEAVALVQRVFPMHFERTLDRQHIAMHIPITYSPE